MAGDGGCIRIAAAESVRTMWNGSDAGRARGRGSVSTRGNGANARGVDPRTETVQRVRSGSAKGSEEGAWKEDERQESSAREGARGRLGVQANDLRAQSK
eukprot:2438644-Rhodomonas_salina.2